MPSKTIEDRVREHRSSELLEIIDSGHTYSEEFREAAKKEMASRKERNFEARRDGFIHNHPKWIVFDEEIYRGLCLYCKTDSYFFKILEKSTGNLRFTFGEVRLMGARKFFTWKDLFRPFTQRNGIPGLCGRCERISMQCPYCQTIALFNPDQNVTCPSCTKLIEKPDNFDNPTE